MLRGLTPGSRLVQIGDAGQSRKKFIQIGAARTLTLIVDSDPNAGTLIVQSNEEDAQLVLLLQGAVVGQGAIHNGQWRARDLPAREYTVRVTKEGYTPDAAEKTVAVKKNEDATLKFQFQRILVTVTVTVLVHTEPQARLLLDAKEAATAGPSASSI